MKKRLLCCSVLAMFVLSGCSDNAFDSENGLIGSSEAVSNKALFSSIKSNVLGQNSQNARELSESLLEVLSSFKNETDATNQAIVNATFKDLVDAYKSLEVSYIADDYNSSLEDTLRYIDAYHEGNEDITEQLERIVASKSEVSSALYRNPNKSINAIEYMLYKYEEDDNKTLSEMIKEPRRIEMLEVMVEAIKEHLSSIETFYINTTLISSNEDKSADAILNSLIDSAYKLREWRVGEAGGFTNKYKNNPSASRLEYFRSAHSAEAMIAILKTHQSLMSTASAYENYATFCISRGALNEVNLINKEIEKAIIQLQNMSENMGDDVKTSKMQNLYETLKSLDSAYKISLTAALAQTGEIEVKIIEADGD